MQAAARVARFGSVLLITGSDFVREVSQAPADVWVVVLLFKDGYFSLHSFNILRITNYYYYFLYPCLDLKWGGDVCFSRSLYTHTHARFSPYVVAREL